MNAPHLHLAVAHLPVVGVVAAVLLLLAALRSGALRRAALVATLLAALTGPLAWSSGESAEEAIEGAAGIEEVRVERHEDLALVALAGLGLAGTIALAGLVVHRRRLVPGSLLVVLLVVDVAAAVLLSRAATLGGEIAHPEIRADAAPLAGGSGSDEAD